MVEGNAQPGVGKSRESIPRPIIVSYDRKKPETSWLTYIIDLVTMGVPSVEVPVIELKKAPQMSIGD